MEKAIIPISLKNVYRISLKSEYTVFIKCDLTYLYNFEYIKEPLVSLI